MSTAFAPPVQPVQPAQPAEVVQPVEVVAQRGADLRPTFGNASSSVWVVTTAVDGRPVGFTAISLVSVSVAPPLVSFNVSRTASSAPALLASRSFSAHLLAGDQEELARRFAGPASERFGRGTAWRWGTEGLPVLEGAVARLSGVVDQLVDAGDSHLVVGRVLDATTADGEPLVHWRRSFSAAGGAR